MISLHSKLADLANYSTRSRAKERLMLDSIAAAESTRDSYRLTEIGAPSRGEQMIRILTLEVTRMEAHFADSKDFGREAVVVAAADVPDSAVDSSTLHLMQAGVQFVTAVPVPMDLKPDYTGGEVVAAASGREVEPTHVDLDFGC